MFHKVNQVIPMDNYCLSVEFTNGVRKIYDMRPLLEHHDFFQALLTTPGLFKQVRPDLGGYGIIWNDEIDLSSEELWQNGITTEYK